MKVVEEGVRSIYLAYICSFIVSFPDRLFYMCLLRLLIPILFSFFLKSDTCFLLEALLIDFDPILSFYVSFRIRGMRSIIDSFPAKDM